MPAFRTGRKGRYVVGVGEPAQASPAVRAIERVLDRRQPSAPRTPPGMTWPHWMGTDWGTMIYNADGSMAKRLPSAKKKERKDDR